MEPVVVEAVQAMVVLAVMELQLQMYRELVVQEEQEASLLTQEVPGVMLDQIQEQVAQVWLGIFLAAAAVDQQVLLLALLGLLELEGRLLYLIFHVYHQA